MNTTSTRRLRRTLLAMFTAIVCTLSIVCAPVQAYAKETQLVSWQRIWGSTALDTMQNIVKSGWNNSNVAILATNANFPDALAASSLAGANNAPVLMTSQNTLSSQTRAELARLGVKKVFIVGGPAAVSDKVADQVSAMGISVVRLWGQTADSTAVAIANKVSNRSTTCIVTTNKGFKDALSAAPYAYATHSPVFLARNGGTALSQETLQAIKKGGYTRIVIVGGPAAVSSAVENQLKAIANTKRIYGQTAVDTSTALAEWEISQGMSVVNAGFATTGGFKDALAGAALCGKNNAVLMLVNSKEAAKPAKIAGTYKTSIKNAVVFGGEKALSKTEFNTLSSKTTAVSGVAVTTTKPNTDTKTNQSQATNTNSASNTSSKSTGSTESLDNPDFGSLPQASTQALTQKTSSQVSISSGWWAVDAQGKKIDANYSLNYTGSYLNPISAITNGKVKIQRPAFSPYFANNKEVGTATVTIKGNMSKGYTGSFTAKFKIAAVVKNGWYNENGMTVYYANGTKYVNKTDVNIPASNGHVAGIRSFKSNGEVVTGWNNNKYYNPDNDGVRVSGHFRVPHTGGANWYYFNPSTGVRIVNQWMDNRFFGNDGVRYSGMRAVTYGGGTNVYYFDPSKDDVRATNMWYQNRFFGTDGVRYSGERAVTYGGGTNTYYFDPANDCIRATNRWYQDKYFDGNGVRVKGEYNVPNGNGTFNKYYFNYSTGVRVLDEAYGEYYYRATDGVGIHYSSEEYARLIFDEYNKFRLNRARGVVCGYVDWDEPHKDAAMVSAAYCANAQSLVHNIRYNPKFTKVDSPTISDILYYSTGVKTPSYIVKKWETSNGHRYMMQCANGTKKAAVGVVKGADGRYYVSLCYNFVGCNQSGV